MAAQFFQMAQAKGVTLDDDDLSDDEDDDDDEDYEVGNTVDDDDDDDDDEEPNIPQGAVDAFLDKKLTDDRLYSEVKERVLDTAGGFVDMVRGPSDDDDDDDDDDDADNRGKVIPYSPPLIVPDSELTAGEVVLLVLDALKNNDNPTVDKGVDILFGYSSSGSQIKNEEGLTPKEYGEFLKETEYKALFEHINVVSFM